MNNSNEIISIYDDLKMIRPPLAKWPEPANVYFIKDNEGISLFDVGCGCVLSVERVLNALKTLGWDKLPVEKIVLSHAHPDHIGGMDALLPYLNPKQVILHEIDVPYANEPKKLHFSFDIPLCNKKNREKGDVEGNGFDLLGYFEMVNCPMCSADINKTVKQKDIINIGRYNFEVIHTPGHAPGHISLYDADTKVLLAGDIVGEIVAWYAPSSGGAMGYLESLQKVYALDIDIILPSHGDVIKDPKKMIKKTQAVINERDGVIINALKTGPKSFHDLNAALFAFPLIQFFPGAPMVESHLQKLIKEEKVELLNKLYSLSKRKPGRRQADKLSVMSQE